MTFARGFMVGTCLMGMWLFIGLWVQKPGLLHVEGGIAMALGAIALLTLKEKK